MDTSSEVRCPFLPVSHFHDNLEVSSLSNAVGSVVEFICTGGEVLSGPSILQCSASGIWNGSIPTCIDNTTQATFTSLPVADGSSTLPPTASAAEFKVETVLIVLWVTGGLLLVTLVVLMMCILTTHKKRQRDRTQRHSPRAHGQPRHGGINPTFSNYDEIWTWIPVVNGNTDNCQNENSASARENSATQTNRELMRNLRLPSYNEAIREGQTGSRHVNQSQIVPQRQNVIQTQAASSSNAQRPSHTQINENRNNRTNNARSTQVPRNPAVSRENRCQSQNGSILPRYHIRVDTHTSGVVSADQHHYETIPADFVRDSNTRNNIENTTNVRVVASSALQQARDLVNQSSAHGHRPPPYTPGPSGSRAPAGIVSSRDSNWRLQARANPVSQEQRRGAQDSRAQVHRSTQNNQRSSYDFRHSEASVFEYYGEGDRRSRTNIPATSATADDPPPPYRVSREPNNQGGNTTSGHAASVSSATAGATSMRTGFESQYF